MMRIQNYENDFRKKSKFDFLKKCENNFRKMEKMFQILL